MTTYHTVHVRNDFHIAYAEAGNRSNNTTILLLHGFPSSSNQFDRLIPLLSSRYHVIAPDLPGFGLTSVPQDFDASFATLTEVLGDFLDTLHIESFIPYVFDYGAPTAYRLALQRPQSFKGLIIQNGNAYEEGLSSWWDPLKEYWKTEKESKEWYTFRDTISASLSIDGARTQYTSGLSSNLTTYVNPQAYTLDYLQNLAGSDNAKRQLDLFYDYQNNVKLYPQFQRFFRDAQLPTLILWGKNDQYFPLPGAYAYQKDLPNAQLRVFEDGSHFLLTTHVEEVAGVIKEFLERRDVLQ